MLVNMYIYTSLAIEEYRSNTIRLTIVYIYITHYTDIHLQVGGNSNIYYYFYP